LIIACLSGGLGNQLFQYAFARFIAHEHNTELWINAWHYSHGNPKRNNVRDFELRKFNIFCQKIIYEKQECHVERISADPSLPTCEVLKLGDNLILSGEWATQNDYLFDEKYRSLLLGELKPRFNIEGDNFNIFKEMIDESANSVAVHVRRGDYRSLQNLFITLGEDYYKRAFYVIERNLSDPEYFVFSDEIDFVQNSLKFQHKVHFVKTGSPIKDFDLNRRCRHSINSNSTYSWWAAYANEHKDKIVIMPKKYFAKEEWQADYEKEPGNGYMPTTWLKV